MPRKTVSDSVPAYRRVADELRRDIMSGVVAPGGRLASEARLAERFGVSRSSIREALRILASEQLIDTTRGATGGSTVQRLEPSDVVAQLRTSIGALVSANGCSNDEMDEVRELLEVTGAFLAAQRRTPIDLDHMRSSIPADARSVPTLALLAEAIFPEESLPAEWVGYTQIDALWFSDKAAARAEVDALKPV